MNKVVLLGRLVGDPETVKTASGVTIAKFRLAVDRRFKKEGEQNADFISCVAFGKTGEFAEKYLKKGTKILCEGRWETGSYKKQDGTVVYTNECVVESMEFVESKKSNETPEGFVPVPDNVAEELPFV